MVWPTSRPPITWKQRRSLKSPLPPGAAVQGGNGERGWFTAGCRRLFSFSGRLSPWPTSGPARLHNQPAPVPDFRIPGAIEQGVSHITPAPQTSLLPQAGGLLSSLPQRLHRGSPPFLFAPDARAAWSTASRPGHRPRGRPADAPCAWHSPLDSGLPLFSRGRCFGSARVARAEKRETPHLTASSCTAVVRRPLQRHRDPPVRGGPGLAAFGHRRFRFLPPHPESWRFRRAPQKSAQCTLVCRRGSAGRQALSGRHVLSRPGPVAARRTAGMVLSVSRRHRHRAGNSHPCREAAGW